MASSFTRYLDHIQRSTTVGRTPLDEWSDGHRDLYLTTHNTQQQTNIHAPGGIRTHDLSRRATVNLRLRPRAHWDRHINKYGLPNKNRGTNCMCNRVRFPMGSLKFLYWHNPHYSPGFDSASMRNKYQEYFLGGKVGRCLGLTTLPPSYADCHEIWELHPPGTLRACPGLCMDCFVLSFIYCM